MWCQVIRWEEVRFWWCWVGNRLKRGRESRSKSNGSWIPSHPCCLRFQRISVGSICKDRPPWMVLDHFVELLAFFGPKRDFPSQLTLHRLGPTKFCERKDVVALQSMWNWKAVSKLSEEEKEERGWGRVAVENPTAVIKSCCMSLASLSCQIPFLMLRF